MSQVLSSVTTGNEKSSSTAATITAAIVFVALYLLALFAAEAESLTRTLRVGIALLPIPAFVLFLVAWMRGIRSLDELERRVQLEALAVAFPLALVLVMGLGLVQRVLPLNPADWSYRHVWPLLIAFYFMGYRIARRRYQ
jgi:hypothetical protein